MARKAKVVEEVVVEEKVEGPELSETFLIQIQDEIKKLQENMEKSTRFAASAKRARKCTTNLQKMFKDYRAASVAFWKNV